MAKGERSGGRKGTAAFAWTTWSDVGGKKDFKGIFWVTHTNTHASCFDSFMKDKGKPGKVFIYFYFPLGLSLETARLGECHCIWVTQSKGQRYEDKRGP